MTHPSPNLTEFPCLNQSEAWNDPILFHELDTPEIYAQWLPTVLGEFAAAVAQATETPEALVTMTLLGILSTVCAQRLVISPKVGWQEPINIYTLIALPPANHKSWVIRACTQPLIDWEEEQKEKLQGDIKRQYSERKTQEKIIEALRHKAAKTQDKLLQGQYVEEIIEKEKALIEVAHLPMLFTNDATPESLTSLVHQQGGRLAIFSDEGGMLETLAGLYTAGTANMDILLKGIDGGELRVERKDRRLTLRPYLTIVFAVQPTVIQTLGEKRMYVGNGALDRFLYALPNSKLGYRTHQTPPISSTVENAYHAKITRLLNHFGLSAKDKPSTIQVLTLSPEAYAAWRDFQAAIEIELRTDGKLSSCLGWGGKLCGFALRIAGLLHTAEHEFNNLTIQVATMHHALAMSHALIDHALAAFGLMGINQATEDAKILFYWIKAQTKLTFTQSEITLAMRNRKLTSTRLTQALELLRERQMISAPIKLPTRKPTTLYHVNPKLFSNENIS